MVSPLVVTGKVDLIKEFHIPKYPQPAGIKLTQEFAEKHKPTLDKLSVGSWIKEWAMDFKAMLTSLCVSSEYSLKYLEINHMHLLLLIPLDGTKNHFVLHNLHKMKINYDRPCDEGLGFNSLARLDFQKIFPALDLVIVDPTNSCTPHAPDDNFYETRGQLRRIKDAPVYYGNSVKKLKIIDKKSSYDPSTYLVQILSKIFPCVTHLQIVDSVNFPRFLKFLWTGSYWRQIESITITQIQYYDYAICKTYDHVFTGISKQDCILLKTGKKSYKNISRLRSGPSIINLKSKLSF